ncbi:MAG: hypothetical protein A3C43_00090 [Candidatus Schekmanbacteria bacterium RIFCSPHIGHO2_02_FULL_38_11]|uniref:Lipoprotein n=1 Tax=Candidatus Schekmanbacteria bacterium RIFCSPLOWO2_12_FULL_38_15 TaxID=1817883 RepID=A0A1F7SFW3_9BACT|nr:MAG: hypothetical protein A2043_07350 [Candidatus Schekmanbacteria bacterium GWA2_38_9]OGL49152.1 MAG: hypothetical protein A3H37_04245 [Candidatus Schekmanbacteria bacterium RIFCSPLOWO2_02_FULL_38_14]OGL52128.1 MAG: hypothetical protein A3G31_06830 [Candidatus Schekmanbacteria bacterium RIFCSPLOWO2_12_FULL_38_15]OGL55584.1 MAG: hypothetical protein A3C43_00090 [Candidatus Schekmanbacteria bacterium RIFCSPHIGHO2_02_FULL_38_11]
MKNIQQNRKYLRVGCMVMSMAMFLFACSFQHRVPTFGVLKSKDNIPEGSQSIGLVHAEVWRWNMWYGDDFNSSQEVFRKLEKEARKRGGNAVVDVSYRTEIHDFFLLIIFFVPFFLGWTEAHGSGTVVKFPEKPFQKN